MNIKIVGIDYPCTDIVMKVDIVPPENQVARLLDYSWQCGGKVATALAAVGRLGVGCGIVGVIGDDWFGKYNLKDFKRHGVDTECIKIAQGMNTYTSLVLSDDHSNGRRIFDDDFDRRLCILEKSDIDRHIKYITSADYLHVTKMDDIEVYASKLMRSFGKKVSLDADMFSQQQVDNIDLVDIFIGSEEFYQAMFPDNQDLEGNMRDIAARGPEIVSFTFGKKGAAILFENEYKLIPAYEFETVDTVGAGDTFHGAFLAGLTLGFDPFESIRFASCCAGIKVTRPGGRSGLPTLQMVMDYMSGKTVDFSELDKRVSYYKNAIFSKTE